MKYRIQKWVIGVEVPFYLCVSPDTSNLAPCQFTAECHVNSGQPILDIATRTEARALAKYLGGNVVKVV